jgi:hypothetical protein
VALGFNRTWGGGGHATGRQKAHVREPGWPTAGQLDGAEVRPRLHLGRSGGIRPEQDACGCGVHAVIPRPCREQRAERWWAHRG